jgi:hypothetical protein
MAEIFDFSRYECLLKPQTEQVQQKEHEYKLIGRQRKRAGHTLFSFNYKTGEVKKAPVQYEVQVGLNGHPIRKSKLVVEPYCIYRQALNIKNFAKILVREGILREVKK